MTVGLAEGADMAGWLDDRRTAVRMAAIMREG
jgi:hypothetical protein